MLVAKNVLEMVQCISTNVLIERAINQTLWSWFWPITTHLNNQPVLFCASGTYKSEIEDINSIL